MALLGRQGLVVKLVAALQLGVGDVGEDQVPEGEADGREGAEEGVGLTFVLKDDDGWFKLKFPEGVDELYFEVVGIIKDKERLKNLFDLFRRMGQVHDTVEERIRRQA